MGRNSQGTGRLLRQAIINLSVGVYPMEGVFSPNAMSLIDKTYIFPQGCTLSVAFWLSWSVCISLSPSACLSPAPHPIFFPYLPFPPSCVSPPPSLPPPLVSLSLFLLPSSLSLSLSLSLSGVLSFFLFPFLSAFFLSLWVCIRQEPSQVCMMRRSMESVAGEGGGRWGVGLKLGCWVKAGV